MIVGHFDRLLCWIKGGVLVKYMESTVEMAKVDQRAEQGHVVEERVVTITWVRTAILGYESEQRYRMLEGDFVGFHKTLKQIYKVVHLFDNGFFN